MNIKKIKKAKSFYNLDYIEKIFKMVPLFFIFILTIVAMLITYFILESNEKRDIDLLKQNKKLHFQFEKKEKLKEFVLSTSKYVDLELNSLKEQIQKNTYRIMGNLDLLTKQDNYLSSIENFLQEYENSFNIKITVFEKDSLNIVYGKNNIQYLEDLIFGIKNTIYEKKVLQYIVSQGKNNLQSWKNDLKGTLRFSFFDVLKIKNKEYYIGTFSNVKNSKDITKNVIIDQIKSENNANYHIWVFDLITKKSFNYYGKKQFINIENIEKDNSEKYNILSFYNLNEEENKEYQKLVSYNYLYNYIIAIDYDLEYDVNTNEITNKYNKLFTSITSYIFIISFIITLFSFFFSNFIKNILDRYNKKLQKRTASLIHWKKRFELAIIASNDGLWDIDFATNNIYFSQKWLEISGYKKGEVSTFSDWFSLIHNEDKANVEKLFDKIFAKDDDTFICEYRLQTKNEGFRWILARGKSFLNDNNELDRMLMMSMDIDKNKRMKKELLDVELLVEDGKIVIFKLCNDKNLSVKYISNSIQTFGYTKRVFESNDMSLMDLIYKDDIDKVQAAINAALNKDLQNFTIVCRVINAANEIRWISSRVILIKNHSGDVSHFYGYINDITKIKVSQEELKLKVEDEVKKNREKDRILIQQSKLASMGEMIGNIAHQWRQPLNNVSLILQFLKDNYKNEAVSSEKLEKFMNRANTHIEYMSETIDDFRNFYKPSKVQNEFFVKECIDTLLHMVKHQHDNENIKIKFQSDDIIITNYENELKQSILNILNNAKDALVSKKQIVDFDAVIDVSVKKCGDTVQIEIMNNGDNIKEEILDRIF